MIPVIFLMAHQRALQSREEIEIGRGRRQAGRESAAVLGFSSAVAAYGAFFIPKSFGTSIAATGGPQTALLTFLAFEGSCIALTWWYYTRHRAEMPC